MKPIGGGPEIIKNVSSEHPLPSSIIMFKVSAPRSQRVGTVKVSTPSQTKVNGEFPPIMFKVIQADVSPKQGIANPLKSGSTAASAIESGSRISTES